MTKLILLRTRQFFANRATVQYAKWRFPRPPGWCRRIVFSDQKLLEPSIRRGFAHWPVEIEFANPANLILDNYDLVVPLNVSDALWLSQQAKFNERNPIPVPSAKLIGLCDDKKAFDSTLMELGFSANVPVLTKSKSYPYIVKKRRDHSSINTHIIHDRTDESHLRLLLDDPEYVVQRLVLGHKEYATHINFTGGKVVSELTVEYTFSSDKAIKVKDKAARRYGHCPDIRVLEAMLRALRYDGLCCFNYKIENGVLIVIELNPRFGVSLCPLFFTFVGAIKARQ